MPLGWGGKSQLGTGGWAGMLLRWQTTNLVVVGFERALWIQKPVQGSLVVGLSLKMILGLVGWEWTGMG